MALEAFLINPAKKSRRKKSGARKRKGGGLPGGLLSRMIRTYGIKRGMKEAWKAHRSGKRNPFGEEVMIVGNPKGRRKKVRREVISTMATKRRRVRRKRVRRNEPGRKRVHHRRHYSLLSNARTRRVVRRVHHRRHHRRNPASTGLGISARRPMSLLMPAAMGTGGYFAADYIPIAIGMSTTPMYRIGIKAALAVGGSMLLSRFLGGRNAAYFSLGVGINVLNDVLKTYVFKTTTTAGLGAFVRPRLGGMGMGAFVPSPYSRPANYRS
jgi:hypothetical protein